MPRLKLTEASQSGLCCEITKRQSTVLQVSHCSTNPASCLASVQDRRQVPVVEKHGWKHYNMAALLAPPAESPMHRYILHSQKCEDHSPEKPAFRNLQGTALQITHTLSSPGGTCLHRGQKKSQQEENLPEIIQKLIKPRQQASQMATHTLSSYMPSVFSTTPPKKFNFQQSHVRRSFLGFSPWPDHPTPSLASGHEHGTASPFRDAIEN